MAKKSRMIGTIILTILGLTIIAGTIFYASSPQFGGSLTKKQKSEYAKFENFKNGKFVNQAETSLNADYWEVTKKTFTSSPNRKPKRNIEVEKIDKNAFDNLSPDTTYLFWFGHSTVLLIIDGKKILIDPMFSNKSTPIPFAGAKRYYEEFPLDIEDFPTIDIVIVSHNHYDHLDYNSTQQLKNKVGQYYVPLGVGNNLRNWGIADDKIHELNWWDSVDYKEVNLVCAPARHGSGRGMFDNNVTLWCSWIIKGKKTNVFFSGDGGYDEHFKEIGEKYGKFDVALIECGQYDENWKAIHLMPEETAQAGVDLQAELILPIHWGAFTIAYHDWAEPVERLMLKAKELNIAVTTPEIGEMIIVGDKTPTEKWWEKYMVEK